MGLKVQTEAEIGVACCFCVFPADYSVEAHDIYDRVVQPAIAEMVRVIHHCILTRRRDASIACGFVFDTAYFERVDFEARLMSEATLFFRQEDETEYQFVQRFRTWWFDDLVTVDSLSIYSTEDWMSNAALSVDATLDGSNSTLDNPWLMAQGESKEVPGSPPILFEEDLHDDDPENLGNDYSWFRDAFEWALYSPQQLDVISE